jgi:hypothetical protein
MYEYTDDEINKYLRNSPHRDSSARIQRRTSVFSSKKPSNVTSREIDLAFKPHNMEYGYVKYWSPSEGSCLENVEWHKSEGFTYVLKIRHQELTNVSESTQNSFREVRETGRSPEAVSLCDFDHDLIKKNGLVLMERDKETQYNYEFRVQAPVMERQKQADPIHFNAVKQPFGMKLDIGVDEDNSIQYANYV